MAGLSDAIKEAEGAQGAQTNGATTDAAGKAANKGKTDAFKTDGQNYRNQNKDYDEVPKKSDSIEFIAALTDPKRRQNRVEKKNSVESYVVVGYKFRAKEDIEVPFAPYVKGMKSFLDVEEPTWRTVKAGETFGLNIVETGILISKPEFAGTFSGGDRKVFISAKASKDRDEMLPILMQRDDGSIKEGAEHIADLSADKKTATVKPEYEASFANIYYKKAVVRDKSGAKKSESSVNIAAAFYDFYKKKNYIK